MARGIRGVLVECYLYFSESPVCPGPACIGCIIVRSLLLAGAANSESIVPGPRDWLATYVFLPLRRWHYKFPCKPLICFSQSHSLYYLDLLLALLGSNLRGRGCCCVQVVRTWLRSSMIVKTEEDPLKEADIMVENFFDHVIMEVWDNKEHFVPLLFQIQSVFKALPWKQVIDCQFSEQTPGPPFSPSCCT